MLKISRFYFSVWRDFTRQGLENNLINNQILLPKKRGKTEINIKDCMKSFKDKEEFVKRLKGFTLNYSSMKQTLNSLINTPIPKDFENENLISFGLFCHYLDTQLKDLVSLYYSNSIHKANSLLSLNLSNSKMTVEEFVYFQIDILRLLAKIHQRNKSYSIYIFRHLRSKALFLISKNTKLLSVNDFINVIVYINRMGFESIKWTYIFLGFLKQSLYELDKNQIELILLNIQQYDLDYLKRIDSEKALKYKEVHNYSLEKFRNTVSILLSLYLEKNDQFKINKLNTIAINLVRLKIPVFKNSIEKLMEITLFLIESESTFHHQHITLFFNLAMLERINDKSKVFSDSQIYFYERMESYIFKQIDSLDNWKTIGKTLFGFSRVNYIPFLLLKELKPVIIEIFQNTYHDTKLSKIGETLNQLENKVQGKDSTINDYFKSKEKIKQAIFQSSYRTNSLIELLDILSALATFSSIDIDTEFNDSLYDIVDHTLQEFLANEKQIENFISIMNPVTFIIFCRNCCLLFEPKKAINIVFSVFELINSYPNKFSKMDHKSVTMLFQ